jgi:hypothetical protein
MDNFAIEKTIDRAFKDSAIPPDAPDRQSIEVRCIVLYN